MYCTAKNCRFKHTHNIRGHRCWKCKSFGHAVDDCASVRRNYTLNYIPEEKKCSVENCQHRDKHTTEGHCCGFCRNYGHGLGDCPSRTPEECLKTTRGNVFYVEYGGMGGYIFNTRTSRGEIRSISLHGDDWGQYSPPNTIHQVLNSLEGFSPLRTSDFDFVDRMKKCYSSWRK